MYNKQVDVIFDPNVSSEADFNFLVLLLQYNELPLQHFHTSLPAILVSNVFPVIGSDLDLRSIYRSCLYEENSKYFSKISRLLYMVLKGIK